MTDYQILSIHLTFYMLLNMDSGKTSRLTLSLVHNLTHTLENEEYIVGI